MVRRSRAVLKRHKSTVLRNLSFNIGPTRQVCDVHFTAIAPAAMEGVLIMFGGSSERAASVARASSNPENSRSPAARKHKKETGKQPSRGRRR